MKQLFFTTLLYLLSFSVSHAQVTIISRPAVDTIKGIVIDAATKTALSHVSIQLRETGSDQIHKGTFTNDSGFFLITHLPMRPYRLTLTYTGYQNLNINLPAFTASIVDLGFIALLSLARELKVVQVAAVRPVVEQSLDKLVYHVDADPQSSTASAFDIMQKIPHLSVDADDNLQLNNNSDYRILINGKPSSILFDNQTEVLKNMPAHLMKTIEVITVPASRYEAQGVGGIINIITYKKSLSGYHGGVQVQASNPNGYSASVNASVTLGQFSFSGNYGYNSNNSPFNSNTLHRLDNIRQSRLQQLGTNQSYYLAHNGSTGLTWTLNDRNQVTLNYNRNQNNGRNNAFQASSLSNGTGSQLEAYNHINNGYNSSRGNDFSLDYQRNFKKKAEQQLTISYRWNNNISSSNSHFLLQPLLNFKEQSTTAGITDDIHEQTLQADYVQPIQKHTLELGINATRRQSNSNYLYSTLDTATNVFVADTIQSNRFHYGEDISAAYMSIYLRMGKWGLKTGARFEVAKVDAQFISLATQAIPTYKNLIPSITLSHRLKGTSQLRATYTQRLQRPSLNDLNPYIDQADPQNISYGNPELQPALTHIFNLAYSSIIKKTALHLNVFHQFTNNAIQQYTTLGADTIAHTTFKNVGRNQNSSLTIGANTTFFKVLNFNMTGTLNYIRYSSQINGKPYASQGLTYNASGAINLRLKSWSGGCHISYNAPNILLQGRSASYVSNSITINKYFFKSRCANLSLSVNSPFRKYRRAYTRITDPYFDQWRESITVIRRFNLSLNYRFVKLQTAKPSGNNK